MENTDKKYLHEIYRSIKKIHSAYLKTSIKQLFSQYSHVLLLDHGLYIALFMLTV